MKNNHKKRYLLIKSAILASVSLSVFLTIVKFLIWDHTGSLSLQATLADSLLDLLASSFNMIAIRFSIKNPNSKYQFGYHKAEAVGALIQSLFVLAVAIFIMYESFLFFIQPEKIDFSLGNILMIIISVILVCCLILYQRYVISKTDSTAVKADEIHYRGDLFHYLLALIVMISVKYIGWIYIDPIGGILIALYIGKTSVMVFFEAVGILIDVQIPNKYLKKIIEIINQEKDLQYISIKTRSASGKFYIYLKVPNIINGCSLQVVEKKNTKCHRS